MISFIVPAHNESAGLARTLEAIQRSTAELAISCEIVVVNDASTDDTAEIASRLGARVVEVAHRQIAATRNSGARAAAGERLFFVDADTTVTARAIRAALHALDRGASGGGAWTRLEDDAPAYGVLMFWMFNVAGFVVGMTGGAFLFCTREAFERTGGFNETLFAGEEAEFAAALQREGRFVVLWQRVATSSRRFQAIGGLGALAATMRILFFPHRMLRDRARVKTIWYESNRQQSLAGRDAFGRQLSNAAALAILLIVALAPVWAWIPWPERLFADPLGAARVVIGLVLIGAGLLLWPCTVFLIGVLLSQRSASGRVKFALLATLCAWKAGQATWTLVRFFEKLLRQILA